MASVNRVTLLGNLGRDAELKYTPAGDAVLSWSMATTETWNNKAGEKQERTTWHRCQIWGRQAETLAEFLTKGKQIYMEGKIQVREWTDKENQKRTSTEIRADRVVLLGGGERKAQPAHVRDEDVARDEHTGPVDDDSIPF